VIIRGGEPGRLYFVLATVIGTQTARWRWSCRPHLWGQGVSTARRSPITAVTSGALVPGATGPNLSDANALIPPNTIVVNQLDGTPGGVGDYTLNKSVWSSSAEAIQAVNLQVVYTMAAAIAVVNDQLICTGGYPWRFIT